MLKSENIPNSLYVIILCDYELTWTLRIFSIFSPGPEAWRFYIYLPTIQEHLIWKIIIITIIKFTYNYPLVHWKSNSMTRYFLWLLSSPVIFYLILMTKELRKVQTSFALYNRLFFSTKYLGGHSDLIAGCLTFSSVELWQTMIRYQTTLGSSLVRRHNHSY